MAILKAGTTVNSSPVLTENSHNNTGNPHDQYTLTTQLVADYYNKVAVDNLLDLKVDLTQLPSLEQDKLDAQAAATAASISEGNAASSATSASTSASQAATSATSADTSAGNAATSEANALTYRNEALSYRNTASTHATNASASASAASTSASNASTSSTSAGNSASAASTSASQSSTSASNAAASASTANTRANAADASATAASNSAATALTQANRAESEADRAEGYADSLTPGTIVRTSGDQTIGGVKTFSSSPVVPTPTTATQVSTKGYVDSASSAITSRTIAAGNGLTGGGDLTTSRTLTLGTPGTITSSTTNSVTSTSHTHAFTMPAATASALGGVKVRFENGVLYIRTDGSNA